MVLPQGHSFFGPLYWLLLVLLMGVLYLMGGTLKDLRPAVCDIYDLSIIGDLLANLDRDPCAWNLKASDAVVGGCEASLCFDHYLIALSACWNVEGDLVCVGLREVLVCVGFHVSIIPCEGDSMCAA